MNALIRPISIVSLLAVASAASAHNPVVFSYAVINDTHADLWLAQPPKWVSCGIAVSQIKVSKKLPEAKKYTVFGYQSEKGLFGKCANKIFSATFSLMLGPELTDSAVATAQVISTGVNPYGADYRVSCGKVMFRNKAMAKRYQVSVTQTGEETNHCIYRIQQR